MARHQQTHHRGTTSKDTNAGAAMDNTAFTVPDSEKNPTPGVDTNRGAATEPWDAENDPAHPTHSGILAVHKRHKGFQARWVNENAIDRRRAQGYELAKPEDYDVDGKDGRVVRNEMVLMEMPQKEYADKRAGVDQLTDERSRASRAEFRREVGEASRRTGGGVEATDESSDE